MSIMYILQVYNYLGYSTYISNKLGSQRQIDWRQKRKHADQTNPWTHKTRALTRVHKTCILRHIH